MDWLRQIVTGADNRTHDLGKYSWIGSFTAVVATGAWNLWHGIAMDVTLIAQALSYVTVAHAGALFIKRSTEPETPPPEIVSTLTVTPAKAPITGYPLEGRS